MVLLLLKEGNMKLLVGLNNKNILDYLDYTNSFIIGLKDFSINYQEYTLEEIKKIRKDFPNIELFISLNKNIFNDDLEELGKILVELDKLRINGIFFYDLSILSLSLKKHINTPLVFAGEHLTTNYNICNYYLNKGCKYIYLSSEITVDEIKEIKSKSDIKLISFFFGYPEVSFSKRKLLTSYFLHENKEKQSDWYQISSDNQKYFIKESNLGTRILYGNIMNGIKPFYELKDMITYALLNEDLMEHDIFIKGIKLFKELLDNKISLSDAELEIQKLTNSDDTCFYYKKTIYKVKDEK